MDEHCHEHVEPPAPAARALSEAQMRAVAGGINPQPLPPRHHPSFE